MNAPANGSRLFGLDPATYYDEAALDKEMRRVFDICNGCRLCFNLCPSFPELFDRADEKPNEVAGLTQPEIRKVVDLCFDCKLCYPKCPYTPPHEFALDFPGLMLRARAVQTRREGVSRRDRFLSNPELSGKLGGLTAPLSNLANRNPASRALLERTAGIHRQALLPTFHRQTFAKWFASHQPARPGTNGRVVLFYTCSVNYNEPDVGVAVVQVLERNGLEVVCPPQRCCGMPYFGTGDLDAAKASARYNLATLAELVGQGYEVVVPEPSCSLTLRQQYPEILPDDARAHAVAAASHDICDYLLRLHQRGALDTGFEHGFGKIAYHVPCHLKVQNLGLRSRDLLALLPDTEVEAVERCSGHDGTWSMKREYHELSLQVGNKLFRALERAEAETYASDCTLAGLQVEEGTGKRPLHPVQLLRDAYGLPSMEAGAR